MRFTKGKGKSSNGKGKSTEENEICKKILWGFLFILINNSDKKPIISQKVKIKINSMKKLDPDTAMIYEPGSVTILIVDDDSFYLNSLERSIKSLGYNVLAVNDSEIALEKVRVVKPDLVILDVMMPKIDGFEFCRELKNNNDLSNIPVIFITGLNDIENIKKGFNAGGVDYLTKPFHKEEIFARINTHLKVNALQKQLMFKIQQIEHEIEERRTAEEELRNSEELHRITLSSISEAVIITDDEGNLKFICPGIHIIFGYSYEEISAKGNIYDLLGENLFNIVELNLNGELKNIEREVSDKYGERHLLLVTIKKVSIKGGTLLFTCRDITELKGSQEKCRTIVENINDVIFSLDKNGIVIFVSPVVEQFANYTVNEVIGKHFALFVAPEDLPAALEYQQQIHSNNLYSSEFRILTKNGEIRYVKVSGRPLFENGNLTGIDAIMTNVTETKQAENEIRKLNAELEDRVKLRTAELETKNRELSESKSRYKALLHSITNYVYTVQIHNKKANSTVHGPGCQAITGYTPEEYSIDSFLWYRMIFEDDRDRVTLSVNRLLKGDVVVPLEHRIYHKDGSLVWIRHTLVPHYNNQKQLISYDGLIENITERKRTEEALRESEERYRSLFDRMMDGVYRSTHDGYFVDVNTAMIRMFGYSSKEEMLKIDIKKELYFAPEERDSLFLDTGQEKIEVFRMRKKNGEEIWIEDHGLYVHDENGNVIFHEGILRDVTERKIAEGNLRESEERYRMLFEVANDSIFTLDGYRFIECNQITLKMFGCNRKTDIVGHSPWEFSPLKQPDGRDSKEKASELIDTVLAGNPQRFYWIHTKKNGDIFDAEVSLNRIDIRSRVLIQALVRDITERKKVEEALHQSEKRYRKIFENVQDVFYQINNDGIIIEISPSVERYSDYKRDNIIGKPVELLYYNPAEREILLKELEKNGEVLDYEIRLKDLKGRIIYTSVNAHFLYDSDDNLIGIEGSLRDITERKLAEADLKKLKQAIEQSPASITIANVNGIIEYANPKFTELTGYSANEVVGKKSRILKHEKMKDTEYEKLWQAIKTGKEWRGEFYNRKKNKEMFWESALISPIINLDGEITNLLIITEDITAKKKAEKELIDAKERAEKSDKLKSEFLAQMSHEIRSPINTIFNFTELLKEEFRVDENSIQKQFFESIERSGERIIRTIDMILNMSEIQTGSYECVYNKINLGKQVLSKIYSEFIYKARMKNLEFILNYPDKDIYITVDQYSTEQIFVNLIDNAIKYTNKGKVEINAFINENGNPSINICDTGIGISGEFLPNLFNPFTQEEQGYTRKYDGNGLGLALVKKYCEMNNAFIEVKSQKGKGTTFTVVFHKNGDL